MTSETEPARHTPATARLDDVSGLSRGDQIEATGPDRARYRGRVEQTAPEIGVVWITDESLGNRSMLDTIDYSIRIRSCGAARDHEKSVAPVAGLIPVPERLAPPDEASKPAATKPLSRSAAMRRT